MALSLVPKNHPALTRWAAPIDINNQKLLADLKRELEDALAANPNALGLALPQLGISYRGFILSSKIFEFRLKPLFVFNPELEWCKGSETQEEGCLSLPGEVYSVMRGTKIDVTFYDEKGVFNKRTYKNLKARVFQHELDHLNGVLISTKNSV